MSSPSNKAGAKYGTGYCDSQCPRDVKFINGEANSEGWVPSTNDVNAGVGNYGSCCAELDIWGTVTVSLDIPEVALIYDRGELDIHRIHTPSVYRLHPTSL